MEPRRFRAPKADGGLLEEPPRAEAGRVLALNRSALDAWDHDFQGRRTSRLRAMARKQVLEAASAYHRRFGLDPVTPPAPDAPWIVTGHQPELFHPGVWVKNFETAAIARDHGGLGLNLIVDNDIPKWASIRVPTVMGGDLRTTVVDFDDWSREIPYEDWSVESPAKFARFPGQVREILGGLVADPVLDEFWPLVKRVEAETPLIGLRFAAARRMLEGSRGVRNVEVPLSLVCETEAFAWFASHLLAHLARFREVHNAALERYRGLYGIRSRNHPVPSLAAERDWVEAPFWCWRASGKRRRPILARQFARTVQLRIAGEEEILAELPLSPDRDACCAVEELLRLPARGVRLRTRALTTTMFARLVLGDLFLHGIGGAKYDELGDEVLRGFFGIEPPRYLTLSLTHWLGLPDDPATAERLRGVERSIRDLEFNPDRHLAGPLSAEQSDLVTAKRGAIDGPQETRRLRAARYFRIRDLNERLAGYVAPQVDRLRAERDDLRAGLRRNAVARSREYPFVLHDSGRLWRAVRHVAPSAFPD